MKLFNDLHYLPMSRIVLPLCMILPPVPFCPSIIPPPPGNSLMIYAIYPCRVSFCPLDSFCPPYHFAPYHFTPWKSFNVHYFPILVPFCPHIILHPPPPPPPLIILPPWKLFHNLHYLPMSSIILPPWLILPPYHFAPPPYHFAPPPWKLFHDYTIYPCPVSFCPLDSFCPHIFLPPIILPPWKWFNDLHYLPMSRIILPPALDFVFIVLLIKSPLQQNLMTGAHSVTVAPLVK